MRSRFLPLVAAAVLAGSGVARADGPPSPPPAEYAPVALEEGEAWTAPAGGGLCLDRPAFTFQVETRRYLEARARAAEEVAEGQFLRGVVWGVVVGLAAGAVAGALVAR